MASDVFGCFLLGSKVMVNDYNKTSTALSVRYEQTAIFGLSKFLAPVSIILLVLVTVLILLTGNERLWLVNFIVMVSIPILLYFRLGLSNKSIKSDLVQWTENKSLNIAETMSPSAINLLMTAETAANHYHLPMAPFMLMYGFLGDIQGQEMFMRLGLFIKPENLIQFNNQIVEQAGSMDNVIGESVNFALENGEKHLHIEDFLVGLTKSDDLFKRFLQESDLDEKAVIEIALWHKRLRKERYKPPFWEAPVIGGVGQDWAYGYTKLMQQFALNLTKVSLAMGLHIQIFSRNTYVDSIETILARNTKNNVLLVGDYGVGKKTMVKALAKKIAEGNTHPALRYKQIMQVNVGALLSGSRGQGEIVERINGLLNEALAAGNIILFFDDFHALVSSEQTVGSINAAEVLLPYLQGSRVQIIGATNIDRFHKDIKASSGIAQVFERIDLPEQSKEESIKVLEEVIPYLEYKYKVIFIYSTLKKIVDLADRYIHDKSFPQKAIDLASEVAVRVSASGNKVVTPKDVGDIISNRMNVPVGEADASEKDRLLNLEDILHKRVIGQNEAVVAVANALRRARTGLASKNRPVGTFLFIGPTGVGKTEMAKALAEAYYGDEERMIRFDMSEYQDEASIYRLIGTPPAPGAAGKPGMLTTAVHDNPFSLVLLDELEKAHPNLLTLFLQVFDDGRLTGGDGRTIDFTNTTIITTSNAGAEVIREYLTAGNTDVEQLKVMLLDFLQKNGIYRPEFLNRFDSVVVFRPLQRDEIFQVARIMLEGINKQLSEKGISIELSDEAMDYLVEVGYDPVFGARPMRRAIQDKLENVLAKIMLENEVERGTVIKLGKEDLVKI